MSSCRRNSRQPLLRRLVNAKTPGQGGEFAKLTRVIQSHGRHSLVRRTHPADMRRISKYKEKADGAGTQPLLILVRLSSLVAAASCDLLGRHFAARFGISNEQEQR